MGIFSRTSKSTKDAVIAEKPKTPEATPKTAKKFVPRHGAVKAAAQGLAADDVRGATNNRIMEHRRIEIPRHGSTRSNAAYARGSMTASSLPNGQRLLQDSSYEEGYFQSSDPTPMPPAFKQRASVYRPKYQHRESSADYVAASKSQGKHPVTAGYYTPHASSDSGYESAEPTSAGHSRIHSEHNLLDYSKGFLVLSNMPEAKLGVDADAAASYRSADNRNVGNVSPLDLNSDARSIRSNRSVSKRTRFQDDAEPMPSLEALDQYRIGDDQACSASGRWQSNHDEVAASFPQLQPESFVRLQKPQPRDRPSISNFSNQAQGLSASCSARRGSVPPLSVLEGFMVNKRGKILDEEGDAIGELIEGDLLDCVRQKANANGEVIDEYGRVVGLVRPCAASSASTGSINVLQQVETPQEPPATQDNDSALTTTSTEPLMQPPATAPPEEAEETAEAAASDESPPQVEEPAQESPVVEPAEDVHEEHSEEQKAKSVKIPQVPSAQEPRRMPRSASEKSLSELSRTYARPAMSSVPEHNVPEDESIPASPGLFAYRGDIPMNDSRPASLRRRSKSPPQPPSVFMPTPIAPGQLPNPGHYAKMALVGGFSNAVMRPSMNQRRVITHYGGISAAARQPLPSALKKTRYQTSAFEIGLSSSDTSSNPSDDAGAASFGHSRAASIMTTGTAASKARTYFTHGGKVTVDVSARPAQPEPAPKPAAVEIQKKKSRMSMSFGRKSKVAA